MRHFAPYGDVFGEQGTFDAPFAFANELTDATGLLYLRARYYDPSIGRFFNQDPSWMELNLYRYGLSNPTNNSDPSGLSTCNLGPGLDISICGSNVSQQILEQEIQALQTRLSGIGVSVDVTNIVAQPDQLCGLRAVEQAINAYSATLVDDGYNTSYGQIFGSNRIVFVDDAQATCGLGLDEYGCNVRDSDGTIYLQSNRIIQESGANRPLINGQTYSSIDLIMHELATNLIPAAGVNGALFQIPVGRIRPQWMQSIFLASIENSAEQTADLITRWGLYGIPSTGDYTQAASQFIDYLIRCNSVNNPEACNLTCRANWAMRRKLSESAQ